jgi:integrase
MATCMARSVDLFLHRSEICLMLSVGQSGAQVRPRQRESLGQRPTLLPVCSGCGGKRSLRNRVPKTTLIRKAVFLISHIDIGYFHCRERIIAIRFYSSKCFTMPGRRAKILSPTDVNDLLLFATCTRNPLRTRVIVLLSAKAGLRAAEIANLTWDMVLGPSDEISGIVELRDSAAKKGSGRVIPIHPELHAALVAWRRASAKSEYVAD